MKVPIRPRLLTREQLRVALPCAARLCCGFLFTAARFRGQFLPLGACFLTAAGGGLYAVSALAGTLAAALLLLSGRETAETVIVSVLLFSVQALLRGQDRVRLFLPAVAGALTALAGGILVLLSRRPAAELPGYLLRVSVAVAGSALLRAVLSGTGLFRLLTELFFLTFSAASLSPLGWNLGAFLACGLTVYLAGTPVGLPVAAVSGIALDCAGIAAAPVTAVLCLISLLTGASLRLSRTAAAGTAAVVLLFGSIPGSLPFFFSALPGVAVAVLLPGGLYRPTVRPADREPPAAKRMREASILLTDLGTNLMEQLPSVPQADPALIFDRAADRVCKTCALFGTCWGGACEAYDALSVAAVPMLARGAVLRDDFPPSFLARCRHLEALMSAIDRELDGVLYRRQCRSRLSVSRTLLAEQYRVFATYLAETASSISGTEQRRPCCLPVTGIASAGRHGSGVSGDRGASFRTARHIHYLLLCDGMGSGREAHRESTSSVRLLRGLLSAGFPPEDALRMLNSVYLLRDDGAFSTVDLVRIDLSSGRLDLYKWGGAPSYLCRGAEVRKIGTALPPPGLEGAGRAEHFELSLEEGEVLVLLSDGAVGSDTETRLRAGAGSSPKALAASLIAQDRDDDRTAVVLALRRVSRASSHRQDITNEMAYSVEKQDVAK